MSLYQGKLIVAIGTKNRKRLLFLFVLGPKYYVAFDYLTLKVCCTMVLIFKKIFSVCPDSDQANQNGTIDWLTPWSCQGYGHCAANI